MKLSLTIFTCLFAITVFTAFSVNAQLDPPYGTCDAVAGPFTPPDGAATDVNGNFHFSDETNQWDSFVQTPNGGSLPDNAYVFDAIKYEAGEPVDTTLVISTDYTVDLAALGLGEGDVLHAYSFTYDIDTINSIAIIATEQCEILEDALTGNDQVCEILNEIQDNGGFQTLDDAITLAGLFFGEIPSVADAVFYLDTLNQIIVNFGPILGIDNEVCFAYDGYTEILIGETSININAIETQPIDVYPNPASNLIYFDIPNSIQNAYTTIYSLEGKKVYEGPLTDNVNIESLVSGIYTVQINTDGELFTSKFVKL